MLKVKDFRKNRDKMEELKKKIERPQKKDIENKDKSKEKIEIKKKKIIKRKPSKEKMAEIKKRAEEKAYKKISGIDDDIDSIDSNLLSGKDGGGYKESKESNIEIAKEERAERFKKLHELAVRMSNKWKEENKI